MVVCTWAPVGADKRVGSWYSRTDVLLFTVHCAWEPITSDMRWVYFELALRRPRTLLCVLVLACNVQLLIVPGWKVPQYGCRSFYNVYANNTQLASHFHILHHDEKSPQKPLMSVAQVALTCQLKVFLAKTPQLEALALTIPVRTA